MSQQYQVLARKYRPKNFHELIGQTHVSQALINAIDYNRLHHAYLFTGTRGVGKTTIARILSKCLNCDTGITSMPCGVCDNCVAIDEGRFIDLIEIDAASRTKVEDTRELLDNVPYAPSQGRYKVYLIDEVHMLSTHSFNALLKTLEEPPEHVKFLLATTDPQKLPITIISRCLQFVLRPLPQTLLSEHLAQVLTQEQVSYTQPALWQLASAAKGSVRDALSLTDQAIAFGQGALDDATVNSMLGLIDAADLVRLITDIYNHDKPAVAAHIEQMRAQMVDASSMFDGLAELLHQLALTQLLPQVALNINDAQAQNITILAQHISPDVLQLYYEIVVQARESIKLASTPMQGLEMCILRLLAFRPLPVNEILTPIAIENSAAPTPPTAQAQEPVAPLPELHSHSSDQNNINPHPINTYAIHNDDTVGSEFYVLDNTLSESSTLQDTVVKDSTLINEVTTYQESHPSIVALEPIIEPEPNIKPEPVIEPEPNIKPSVNNSHLLSLPDDPRTLLRCETQELSGEWTPEKWDYWLQTAREAGKLAADELALARQGVMGGLCNGKAIFMTSVDSKHLQVIFQQLAEKIKQQFTQIDIELQIDSSISQSDNKTPARRQKMRLQQATEVAQTLLLQSPVMQYLSERGDGKMGSIKLT